MPVKYFIFNCFWMLWMMSIMSIVWWKYTLKNIDIENVKFLIYMHDPTLNQIGVLTFSMTPKFQHLHMCNPYLFQVCIRSTNTSKWVLCLCQIRIKHCNVSIRVRHTKTVLIFENSKTCMSEPFSLSKSHTNRVFGSCPLSKIHRDHVWSTRKSYIA